MGSDPYPNNCTSCHAIWSWAGHAILEWVSDSNCALLVSERGAWAHYLGLPLYQEVESWVPNN